MSTINIKLNQKEVKNACREIREWFQVSLTPKQMITVLNKNPKTMLEVAESKGDLDTSTREEVIEAISKHLTGEAWPTNSDCHTMGKKRALMFYTKLVRKARKLGYKTLDNPEGYMG